MCVVPAGFYTMLGIGNLALLFVCLFFPFFCKHFIYLTIYQSRSKLWCVLMSLHSSNKCKISRSPLRRKLVLLFFFNLILGFFWDCNLFTFLSSLSPLHVLLYISSHTASNPWLPLSSIDKVCIYIYVYVYIPKCNLGSGRGTARPIGVCFPRCHHHSCS